MIKGKILVSQWNLRTGFGRPLLMFGAAILTASLSWQNHAANPPSIHIVHETANVSARQVIKLQYDNCVKAKNTYLHIRSTNPQTWAISEADLRRKNPDFSLDRALAPEPDWSKLYSERDQEYFDGERYALYKTHEHYKIIDDGSCRLKIGTQEHASIDDGVFRYELDLSRQKGTKYPRASAVGAAGREQLRAALQNNPALAQAMGDAVIQSGVPQAAQVLKPNTTGTGRVAGQTCDYVSTPMTGNAKTCFWSTMHEYPATTSRPIILKSIVPIGKDQNTRQAVLFESNTVISPAVFAVPAGISIQDRSRM
jgi:hypothetical protein